MLRGMGQASQWMKPDSLGQVWWHILPSQQRECRQKTKRGQSSLLGCSFSNCMKKKLNGSQNTFIHPKERW